LKRVPLGWRKTGRLIILAGDKQIPNGYFME